MNDLPPITPETRMNPTKEMINAAEAVLKGYQPNTGPNLTTEHMALRILEAALAAAPANPWKEFDRTNPPSDLVDIYVPSVGRITDVIWAAGRGWFVRSESHGLREYQVRPSHWMETANGPHFLKKAETISSERT